MEFSLVFAGHMLASRELDEVRDNLAWLFRITDEGQLDRLFSGRQVVLKSGLDSAQAEKYRQALLQAGYSADNYNTVTCYYEVHRFNGHAWVEGYFAGQGWATFEATPRMRCPPVPRAATSRSTRWTAMRDRPWRSKSCSACPTGRRPPRKSFGR